MNEPASISVVIPNFNSANFLQDSIQSILSQEGNFYLREIIVVDDNSTRPEEPERLNAVKSFDHVHVVKNSRAKGPAGARNTGAAMATADWLAFLDADDVYLPDSLQCRVSAAASFPQAGVVSADFRIHDFQTGATEEPFFRSREKPARLFGPAYANGKPRIVERPYKDALVTAFCHSCSVLVKRSLFWEVGGYEESLIYMEDQHLFYKLALQSDYALVPQVAFLYRIHDSNMTHRVASPFEYQSRMLALVRSQGHPSDLKEIIRHSCVDGHWRDFRWHLSRRETRKAALSAGLSVGHRLRLI